LCIETVRGKSGTYVSPLPAMQNGTPHHRFKLTGERRINELRAVIVLRKMNILSTDGNYREARKTSDAKNV